MKRMLGPLLKLLLLLAAVSYGTATSCDISRDEPVPCYGTLGQSVSMNLKTATNHECSGIQLEIKFNGVDFFRCRNGKPSLHKACNNHCRLVNRAFWLENLTQNLSGTYSFQEFDENGKNLQNGKIELIIQGRPASIVAIVLGTCSLLLALLVGTWCVYKKMQQQTTTSQTSAGDGPEGDPQELVYCEVQVAKGKDRPKKQQQEPQVVYGEVKVR
ncbi:uncharacterized protein LOC133125309 [Conger conger]|uniref:uncharacterized protein LOC133125309 n=1 Tax=Conger conger TaxID=82655 RepID=UPI002A5A26D9|nr:uncharacterized protein LOC133125309 [Conger conger]